MNDTKPPFASAPCLATRDQLVDFAHGELMGKERVLVAGHLAQCRDCALEYCQLRADLEGIAHACQVAVSPGVRESVRHRVLGEFRVPWWRRVGLLFVRPVPVYGAVAVAMIPALLWIADSARDQGRFAPTEMPSHRGAATETDAMSMSSEVRVVDYDATVLLPPSESLY